MATWLYPLLLIAVDCKKEAGFMRAKWLEKWTYIIGKSGIFNRRSTSLQGFHLKPSVATLASSWNLAVGATRESSICIRLESLLSSNERKLNGWIFDIVVSFWKGKRNVYVRKKIHESIKPNVSWLLQLQWNCEAIIKTWTFCPVLF